MSRRPRLRLAGLAIVIAIVIALIVWAFRACSPGPQSGKRKPGPLVIWMLAEPEAESVFSRFAQEFSQTAGIPVEQVFKESWELRPLLRSQSERIKGKVDLVEVDLFDLEETASFMEDLNHYPECAPAGEAVLAEAAAAAIFHHRRAFIPWRLSWPVLVTSPSWRGHVTTWILLAGAAQNQPGALLWPGLDDHELLTLTCAVIWAHGGDPLRPEEKEFHAALEWLAQIRDSLDGRSPYLRSRESVELLSSSGPAAFFAWPETLWAMGEEAGDLPGWRIEPLPRSSAGWPVVLAFGRYVGIPRGAPHPHDACRYISWLVSAPVQKEMRKASPWLPVRPDVWGENSTEAAWQLMLLARQIKTPPRHLHLLQEALPAVARMVLFEGAEPEEAVEFYQKALPDLLPEKNHEEE